MIRKITTNYNDNIQTFDDIVKNVEKNLDLYEPQNVGEDEIQLIKDTTAQLIMQISTTEKINLDLAFILVALILQTGGYLKGVTNRKVSAGDYEYDKRKLLLAMKSIKCSYTLRTIARVNREIIVRIAKKLRVPGNLYSQYKMRNPEILKKTEEIQLQHAVYCTDFQRENPDTPQEVLTFLSTREIRRKIK